MAADQGMTHVPIFGAARTLAARLSDGTLGWLRARLADIEVGAVKELVEEEGPTTRSRRKSQTWWRSVFSSELIADTTPAVIARQPHSRADLKLRGEVLDAWFYDDFLRPLYLCGSVNVQVHDGVADLEGYARTGTDRDLLDARTRTVAGIREVRSAIVADDELARQVELALRGDARTWLLRPRVESSLGTIRLQGIAPDGLTREAAGEVAAVQPSVLAVRNRLRVVA